MSYNTNSLLWKWIAITVMHTILYVRLKLVKWETFLVVLAVMGNYQHYHLSMLYRHINLTPLPFFSYRSV